MGNHWALRFSRQIHFWRWLLWKRRAKGALSKKNYIICSCCFKPIIPGDRVAEFLQGIDLPPIYTHAGIHFSFDEPNAYCAPHIFHTGKWTKDGIIRKREPLDTDSFNLLQPSREV